MTTSVDTPRVTWTCKTGSLCWNAPPPVDEIRTGIYWSPGPVAGTAWVIPDDPREGEGHAVCVHLSPNGVATEKRSDADRSSARYQAEMLAALRFADNLYRPIMPHGLPGAPRCITGQLKAPQQLSLAA